MDNNRTLADIILKMRKIEDSTDTAQTIDSFEADIEDKLAKMCRESLGISSIRRDENFFDMGLHSLSAIEVMAKFRRNYRLNINTMDIFKYPTIRELATAIAERNGHIPQQVGSRPRKNQEKQAAKGTGSDIAVIGMSLKFPGAGNVDEFWEVLSEGRETVSFFSAQELSAMGIDHELLENPNFVRAKGIIPDLEYFDAAFFGYSSKEAEMMDPQIRMFHECAWKAIEDSGYNPEEYSGRIGVFAGSAHNQNWTLKVFNEMHDIGEDIDKLALTDKDFLCTRTSYKLKLRGPSVNVQTACSTALVAVHLACRSIVNGECDMALAGGVTAMLPKKGGYLYKEGLILPSDGRCKAFDADSDGTLFSDGVGIVVLKPLEAAIADGDTVHAVIRGSAINNDGGSRVGFTAPGIQGQKEVIASALHSAGIDPETVTYVETHGTGTPIGDTVEFEALKEAFGTQKKGFCAIGTLKTNMGHLDATAGVGGLIKTILALKNRQIPPSLNFNSPNPDINFIDSPFFVNTKLREWKRIPDKSSDKGYIPLRAGVSSFGIGSTNAHVIVEEAPFDINGENDELQPKSEESGVLTLSARTMADLERATGQFAEFLDKHPEISLSDAGYTLQTGRKQFKYRRAVVGSNAKAAAEILRDDGIYTGVCREIKDIVFIFPDYSNSYEDMCRGLYVENPQFREEMDNCLEMLKSITNYKTNGIGFITYAFIVQYSFARFLIRCGIIPTSFKAEGTGKFAAACLSGTISLKDALLLFHESYRTVESSVNDRDIKMEGFGYWYKGSGDEDGTVFVEIGTGAGLGTLCTCQTNNDTGIAVNVIRPENESGSDTRFFLEKLGQLWCHGVKVDWKQYNSPRKRKRISLPTYPFHGQSYPLDVIGCKKPAADREETYKSHKEPDMDKWFYAPSWSTSALPSGKTLEQTGRQTWLLFMDVSELGEKLALKIGEKGHEVLAVRTGTGFKKTDEGDFIINPGNSEDYVELFKELNSFGKIPQNIVHLWNMDMEEELTGGLDKYFYSLVYIPQAIGRHCASSKINIFILSDNMQALLDEETVHPLKSTLLGPCTVIPKEYPNLSCRSIDINSSQKQDELLEQLLLEFSLAGDESIVAYRRNKRFVESYKPIRLRRNDEMPERLKNGGVYLITGGTGGIGLALAGYIAKIPGVKLILTGRSAFPEKGQWQRWLDEHGSNDKVSKVIHKVKAFEQMGAEVMVVSAEVSDLTRMQHIVAQAESEYGRINGIIHTAGVVGNGVIQLKKKEMVEKVFSPKIKGTLVLDNIFKEKDLDFMVICSSISSALREFGQVDYVAANLFLDSYARYASLRYKNTFTLSINWDTWIDTGILLDAIVKMQEGMAEFFKDGLTAEEGIECFGRLLQANEPQIAVSTKDLNREIELIAKEFNAKRVKNLLNSGRKYPRPELSCEYAAPSNETEHKIASVWEELFRIDKVGVRDNFYELGGDSLIAFSLVSELQKHFVINVTDIYDYPTISALAEKLRYQGGDLRKKIEDAKLKYEEYRQYEKIAEELEPDFIYYRKRNEQCTDIDLTAQRRYGSVLLTGSTGYLGIYLLMELLEKTDSDIYTIVRAEDEQKAEQRIIHKLEFYFGKGIYEKYKDRIFVLKGDLAQEGFGIQPQDYSKLADTIDCVLNSAAKVEHYGKYEEFYNINVGGVNEVVKFAMQGRKKDIHHISTIATGLGNIEGTDNKLFTEYDFDMGQKTDNYYILTKSEAEKKLLEARENGLNVNIYRIGDAVFDSRTGRFQENIENNFIYLMLRALMKLKAMPELGPEIVLFDFAFIDYLSRAVVLLMTREALSNEVFHVFNPREVTFKDFIKESEYIGMDILGMKFGDFLDLLYEKYEDESLKPYITDFIVHSTILEIHKNTRIKAVCERTEQLLRKMGLEWVRPSREQLKKMIDYGREVNFFLD
ncbi:MAG TPA: SDR family NAD(P)-dependent oxidoreductase [Ruminiclostridium sp.]|nr:SDR family NAD(P)-dependent oxidoreductase [Ruminiclostridium sp.]